ncbi:MAG: CsbD family protein [Betaproteobacteria bacterium]
MNKDQVNGRVETAKGNVKEAAGKLVGNERLTAEGRAEQAAGKVQSTVGDVKSNVGDAIKKAIDR